MSPDVDMSSLNAKIEEKHSHRGPEPHGSGLRVRIKPVHDTPKRVLRHTLYLPVILMDELAIQEDAGQTDFTTVGGGEYSQPSAGEHSRMLRTFSLDTATLIWNARWLTYRNRDPEDVRRALARLTRSRRPVHLLAMLGGVRPAHRRVYDGLVTLRSMNERIRHGEPDTRYFDLDFREFRRLHVKERRHGGHGGGGGGHHLPAKHRLHENDTLRSLAKHYYGHGDEWRHIAKANGIDKWGSETPLVKMHRYKKGDVIKIPRRPDRDNPVHNHGDGGTRAPSKLGDEEATLLMTEDQ